MLNSLLFNNKEKIKKAVYDAKNLFSENVPYTIEYRLGEKKVYIFQDHFIRGILEAFTTDCMEKLNKSERQMLEKFIQYEDNRVFRDITSSENEAMAALDKWLFNLANGIDNLKSECDKQG